ALATTPLMESCSHQPSTSFHVQFAGQIDSKSTAVENLQVVAQNGIRKRFIYKPSREFTEKLDVLSNRITVTAKDGTEFLSAPLHSIASISCDVLPTQESSQTDNISHMVGLYFGTARRDEMRMSVVLLYARNESDARLLCTSLNELWTKSYSDYINNFLSLKSEEMAPVNRKRDYSVVSFSSEDFGIASSGPDSPAVPSELNTIEYVKRLMKVVGESLPKMKRATFIQIMRKLSLGEESVLLAMLKLIELFGKEKEQVAEFECIVPQPDLEKFHQILYMHNIKPVQSSVPNI
ncbi:hypothetical protein PENTCL1PPCAC_13786, partial [Pristionchus entomophagus]